MGVFRSLHPWVPVVCDVIEEGDSEVSVWPIDMDVDDVVECGGAIERDIVEYLSWTLLVYVAPFNDYL